MGALKKNPLAQYRYAIQQLLGQGVEQDVKAGFEQLHASVPGLQKLAEQNNADAHFKLGKLYQLGLINSNNFNPMISGRWKVSAPPLLKAMSRPPLAGQMFRLGLGTEKDVVQARELLKTSAAAGSVAAAFQLFDMHYSAGGEVVSETNALVYLKQAAEAGLREAGYLYGNTVGEGRLGLKPDQKPRCRGCARPPTKAKPVRNFYWACCIPPAARKQGLNWISRKPFIG